MELIMSDCSFSWHAFNIHPSGVLTVMFGCHMAGATRNCLSNHVLVTFSLHTAVYSETQEESNERPSQKEKNNTHCLITF